MGKENIAVNCSDIKGDEKKMIDEKTLKAREFVSEVMMLANKYELNCFVVTDGASGITNTDNPAVEHARKCHTEWEVENGIDPEHDWSKNIRE